MTHAPVEIYPVLLLSTEKRTPNSDPQRTTEEATKKLDSRTELRKRSRSESGGHRE